jgi:integrase
MLSQDVERYATLQRALGYKFSDQSRSLKLFADYAMDHGDQFVGVERVLAWAAAQTSSAARRCTLVAQVRRFALAMHAENPRHEVPPRDCVGHAKVVRKSPYIYTTDDIDRIMGAAQQMPPKGFIAPLTLATLLGLLASTGLRISEALALQCSDLTDDGLLIRKSKNNKTRLIPLHETTQAALERYMSERARRTVYTQAVFVSSNGQAIMYHAVRDTFRRLLARAGLRPMSSSSGPRIHDLRHAFAVRSLEQCRHDRQAVAQHMIALSTYLGHSTVTETYWYLEATPIIMSGIAKAGEAMHLRGDA